MDEKTELNDVGLRCTSATTQTRLRDEGFRKWYGTVMVGGWATDKERETFAWREKNERGYAYSAWCASWDACLTANNLAGKEKEV